MRTSKNARLAKMAAVGTAGFMVLSMSGVTVAAQAADDDPDVPVQVDDGDGGDHDDGEGHEGGGQGNGGGGGGQGNGGGGNGGDHGDHGDGDDHGDGGDHGDGNGKGKGNPPAALVEETVIEGELDCELGVEVQVQTVTTEYVWVKGSWVLSDESTTVLSDPEYRSLTADEVATFCVAEEETPPADDGDDEGDDKTPAEQADDTDEVAGAETSAGAGAQVLGVQAQGAPTTTVPTAVSAGLGDTSGGGPWAAGMVAAGLALLLAAGGMALRRPVRGAR